MTPRRIVITRSGAFGAMSGIQALRLLREAGAFETYLIVWPSAVRIMQGETSLSVREIIDSAELDQWSEQNKESSG